MAPVALGASARSFGKDRPWRGHRLRAVVPRPLGPPSGPHGRTRGGRHTGRGLAQIPFLSSALARDPQEAPRPRTKAGIRLF